MSLRILIKSNSTFIFFFTFREHLPELLIFKAASDQSKFITSTNAKLICMFEFEVKVFRFDFEEFVDGLNLKIHFRVLVEEESEQHRYNTFDPTNFSSNFP